MKNAIYLQYEWFSGDIDLSDDLRNDYIYMLNDHKINQQFCDIGIINENGTLPLAGTTRLKQWIRLSRLVDASQKIVLVLNYGNRKKSAQFGTAKFNTNLNNAIKRLISNFQPDGIHLDIEGFIINDTKLSNLLKLIKGSLGERHLSISTPADVWTSSYIKLIGDIVDQMNPMIYDSMGWGSSVVDVDSYQLYFKDKMLAYSKALTGIKCELVPTLPAYELKRADDGTIYHDPEVETMRVAISVLNEMRDAQLKIDGAGIFWGSHFLGLSPEVYNNYVIDQLEWHTNWII
jgi:hypothetical protein